MTNVVFEQGKYGTHASVTAAWSQDIEDLVIQRRVAGLELNDGKGWCGADLRFLVKLPWLQSFQIIDLKIRSVEPIHFLHELRKLEVITYSNTELRFSAFPSLDECALEWRPSANSLFRCTTLRDLFVNRYKGHDAIPFASLTKLETLAILNSPVQSLEGLAGLEHLKRLRIANLKKLSSLAGIESLRNLEELDVNTCRGIGSIDQVRFLKNLKKMHFNNDGNINSIRAIADLRELESVVFYESTNILDGDLSPLLNLPNLRNVSFQNRRHYSHTREEISDARSHS